eukprot:14356186-Ditylum_brightwellii.AAC.1
MAKLTHPIGTNMWKATIGSVSLGCAGTTVARPMIWVHGGQCEKQTGKHISKLDCLCWGCRMSPVRDSCRPVISLTRDHGRETM